MTQIQPATSRDVPEVLQWLKAEKDEGGNGFYCNRKTIAKSFEAEQGLCAVEQNQIVGFVIFQMFTDGGNVDIVEVKPTARRRRLGYQLLSAAVNYLREKGAKYVDAECFSTEGEALCRGYGFEDYADPRNYRDECDNVNLRLYLGSWRPRPPHPFS